jgi:SAM-dependent methyltransferase
MDSTCRICNNKENNPIHHVEENMFGTKEMFDYLECSQCGCIQLLNPPDDISKYYPEAYSNFKPAVYVHSNPLISLLKKLKAGIMIYNKWFNIPGMILRKLYPDDFVTRLAPARLTLKSKILDLGAGNGERILRLSERGFKSVVGIDPFILSDLNLSQHVKVLKKKLSEVDEQFDCIMLNHSFEHMPNPKETLIQLSRLVPLGKFVMIRIPVADSYAWHNYKNQWVALDPPRHFFLHTERSINLLARETGFLLKRTLFDSIEYQFIGSEQLRQGIKLHDANSYYIDKAASLFSERDVRKFKAMARKLNRKGEGDAACFYLIRTKDAIA